MPDPAPAPASGPSRRRRKEAPETSDGRGGVPFHICDETVPPGEGGFVQMPVARLPTGNRVSLPINVLNGARPGPRLWLDAAIHGDEVNGVEIIRRVLKEIDPAEMAGVVVAVPIVNVFGFIHQDRYLPDRRDLNRSFPGSPTGSLAARIAHLFVERVMDRCEVGIDLHTGSFHRTNLPQVRGNLEDPETRRLIDIFGAPAQLQSKPAAGTLRATALRRGRTVILYEAGEPLRFEEEAIEIGVAGVLRVMHRLGMWHTPPPPPAYSRFEASSSRWLRSPRSGIFHLGVKLGDRIRTSQILGTITDPFSDRSSPVRSPFDGLVIGFTNNPLVYQGGALVHLATGAVAIPEEA